MSNKDSMSRVLIVKLGAIGDVIMLIPAARLLHLAGHQIDWVCGAAVLPILQLYPWINPIAADERAILTGGAAARLRAIVAIWRALLTASQSQPYALIATLYYDRRYRLLALPIRAQRRIQLSHSERNCRLLPGRRHTDEFARILLGALQDSRRDGVNPTQLAPVRPENLPPSPVAASGRTRIVLAPAGARNMLAEAVLRRWPAEHYVALAQMLLEKVPRAEILLIGGPDDTWVRPQFGALPVTDLIGALSLPQTIALLDTADVFVTHDTGPLHLGGLTRTNVVALFGPTAPQVFLPQRPGTLAIWGGEGFACRPCYDGHNFAHCPANDCMAQITPQMVLAEIRRMLGDRAAGVMAAPRILTPPSTMPANTLIQIA